MKKHTCLFLALCLQTFLFSQTAKPLILCGNDIFSTIVKRDYSQLDQAFQHTFDQAAAPRLKPLNRSPMKVKVVVHVVWKSVSENLADSVILDQIRVLNEDFSRQNADTAALRAIFQPVAGSAGIQFELADIIRVQTNQLFSVDVTSNNLLSELKHDASGGSDAWDTNKYLNIWVCKIQPVTIFGLTVGQVLGFSFPPNNLDNWPADSGAPAADEDGVVIDFRAFGSNNPNPLANPAGGGNLVIRGRTPTHELGHYFGLRHIWGDGGSLIGPNNCNQSDGVDDTPYANAQSDFDCNTGKNTCNKMEPFYGQDMPDLVENYMDYSSESCMNMFTKGQVAIMQNVLAGPRSGLLEQTGIKNIENQVVTLKISPNPAHDYFRLHLEMPVQQTLVYRVVNAEGRTLLSETINSLSAGTHDISVSCNNWPAGVYSIQVVIGNEQIVKRIMVQ